MAWTAPITWVGGSVPTAALLNAQIRDNMLETIPAKATTEGSIFVATGVNAIIERSVEFFRIATDETTPSTSYADLTTAGPAVTATTGTKAIVFHSCGMKNTVTDAQTMMSWAISGATTRAAFDSISVFQGGSDLDNRASGGMVDYITDLTPGANTFTAKYRVTAGTGSFNNRFIAVIPLS